MSMHSRRDVFSVAPAFKGYTVASEKDGHMLETMVSYRYLPNTALKLRWQKPVPSITVASASQPEKENHRCLRHRQEAFSQSHEDTASRTSK